MVQTENLVIGGAMTDPKGDRSKAPHEQEIPECTYVVQHENGVVIKRAKSSPNRMYQLTLDNCYANNEITEMIKTML